MPHFVNTILNFKDTSAASADPQSSPQEKKIASGKKLIHELKKLFGLFARGNKKYVDPSGVLGSIVDDFG